MAQATDRRPAALIVAHGSPSAPDAQERALAKLAQSVADRLPDWRIASATLAARGRFETECARLVDPVIYPFFMAEGWFTCTLLAGKARARGLDMLRPFAVDPALVTGARTLVQATLAARGWVAADTTVLIAAHGSAVSETSADSALAFAAALRRDAVFKRVQTGFVEQAPFLRNAAANLGAKCVCLPFFALRSGHVTIDLPTALDAAAFHGVTLPPMIEWAAAPRLIADGLRTSRDRATTLSPA